MPRLTDTKKKENKELILNASFNCFSRKGFHKTSMRDIAEEADLSLGAIYVYFETKVEILKALVWKSTMQRRVLLEESGENGLHSILMNLASEMSKPEGLNGFRVDMGIWVALLDDDEIGEIAGNAIEGFINDFATWLMEQQKEGMTDYRYDSEYAARVILATIQGGAVQKIISPEMDLTKYFKMVLNMIKQ